jgi:hypothetical protein
MKLKTLTLLLVFLSGISILPALAEPERNYMEVTSVTMRFEGENATLTIDYNLNPVAKLYVLLFGSRYIEPKIKEIFIGFEESEIIKIDQNRAVVLAKNVSRLDKGYYLHSSHSFGAGINILYIFTPDSPRSREYYNVNSTPYIFYKA